MKSILVLLIFVNIVQGQVVTISPIEIVMMTKNTCGNTINFSATSDNYRWNKQHYLTTQYQTVTISINGDNLGCDHGFGFGNRLEE